MYHPIVRCNFRFVFFAAALSISLFGVLPALSFEPHDEAQKKIDEAIYGKFAFGPKTPTPLDEAIRELNQKLPSLEAGFDKEWMRSHPDEVKAALAPLTVEQVIAVIRNWDRTKRPVTVQRHVITTQFTVLLGS